MDVGGTRLRLGAQDVVSGASTQSIEVPVPRSVDAMAEAITALARQLTDAGSIESVAVGLPGQVLDNRCVWVPNLRFLDGVALGDVLSARLAAPCHLINDAQATLIAEVEQGAARGCADVVLVAVGTGIGGAYQVGGRLVRGANGCAGAFGWLPFSGSRRDEDHGQWERAGSGLALDAAAREWDGTAGLLHAARTGEPAARTVLDRYGAVLGEGIAALASVLDPEVVVFAGGMVAAFELLQNSVRAAIAEHGSPAGRQVRVVPAALGSAAGLIGALRWADRCRSSEAPKQRAAGRER